MTERSNGILKDEFGLGDTLPDFAQTDSLMARLVRAYNDLRPHDSCDYLTPSRAHEQEGPLVRRWKNYYQPAALATPT